MRENDERLRHLEVGITNLNRLVQDLQHQLEVLRGQPSTARETPAGMWKSWTPASYDGWTDLPEGKYRYTTVGKLVIVRIGMTGGTSNDTIAKIGLPIKSLETGGSVGGANAYAMDDGTALTEMSRWAVVANSSTIDFYTDAAAGAWTNSGTKRIYCIAFYEGE